MKKILIALLFPVFLLAQQKIEGKITDEHDKTISQIKVEVFNDKNILLKTVLTNDDGAFSLYGITENLIKLRINDLEYSPFEKEIDFSKSPNKLSIILKKEVSEIQEVNMIKQKPVIKRKIDRLEFNVENSNISSLSAWEILKKTPGVLVSGNNLKIRNSEAILVTINDKKVMLSGEELKNLLDNTQGSDVKSVEVITNPPAKYEASGSAVLNIIMKQNKLEGYRGSISGKYVQSIYAKGVGTLSQFYKKGKFSTMLSYSRGTGNYYREETNHIYYPENQTTWSGIMNRKDTDKNQNSINASVEFSADSLTTFTLNYRAYIAPKGYGLYNLPTTIYNSQNIPESFSTTINDHQNSTRNNNFSFLADRKLNANSKLSFTGYYITNNSEKNQNILTNLDFLGQQPSSQNFISNSNQKIKLYSAQLDYNWKNKKWDFESGLKYSLVKSKSNLDFSDNENGTLVYRPEKSNHFNYKESNFATYISLAYNLDKWSFKGGFRAENTNLTGLVSEPFEENRNNYWSLFPTAYVQYTTENKQEFGISYGKRISRPTYSWLNPAKSYYNLFSYFQGDPKLKATISHILSFTYNVKEWNFELYYRKDINPSMEISYQVPQTKMLVYHYTNIEKANSLGLSLYKNFQLKPWWSLKFSEDISYNENYFFGLDQVLYINKVWNLNSNISTSFILNKATDWNLEFGHQYNSPAIQGTFKISSSWTAYMMMNRKFFDKKLEASLYLGDVFKTSQEKISTKYANQDNYFLDYRDTQQFFIQLKYNFGNQKIKSIKTIKKADEQNRL